MDLLSNLVNGLTLNGGDPSSGSATVGRDSSSGSATVGRDSSQFLRKCEECGNITNKKNCCNRWCNNCLDKHNETNICTVCAIRECPWCDILTYGKCEECTPGIFDGALPKGGGIFDDACIYEGCCICKSLIINNTMGLNRCDICKFLICTNCYPNKCLKCNMISCDYCVDPCDLISFPNG